LCRRHRFRPNTSFYRFRRNSWSPPPHRFEIITVRYRVETGVRGVESLIRVHCVWRIQRVQSNNIVCLFVFVSGEWDLYDIPLFLNVRATREYTNNSTLGVYSSDRLNRRSRYNTTKTIDASRTPVNLLYVRNGHGKHVTCVYE